MTDRSAERAAVTLAGIATGYTLEHGARRIVTRDVNARLIRGEMTCLLGPNGAGKSTLMRTIAGMLPALAGSVLVDGREVREITPRELARKVAVVLTDRPGAAMLSAYGLVALGRQPHTNWFGTLTPGDHAIVRQCLAMVGASELADRMITQLSDGERQKVMVARALAQNTETMVLDEITAFLDLPRRVEVMALLRELAHTTGRAMLLSTHDLDLALRTADRIWLLPRDGPLTTGVPEDLVLSGAFEAAFATEGVEFQAELGAFRIRSVARGDVRVDGIGLARTWTVRALERSGYRVTDAAGAPTVSVSGERGAYTWHLDETPATTYESVESLLRRTRMIG